jgi:hypothetical protein
MLNSDVYWITCEMVVTCDLLCWITTILACMLVGLKSLVISLDYRSYMGSSVRIWSLRWLFLYLCSYNLDGSVTAHFHSEFAMRVSVTFTTSSASPWCVIARDCSCRSISMSSTFSNGLACPSVMPPRRLWTPSLSSQLEMVPQSLTCPSTIASPGHYSTLLSPALTWPI